MRSSRWRIGILSAALLAPRLAAPAAAAESGLVCEKALIVCLSWPGHNLPWDVVECLAGYEYCKKYVEPLLGGQ